MVLHSRKNGQRTRTANHGQRTGTANHIERNSNSQEKKKKEKKEKEMFTLTNNQRDLKQDNVFCFGSYIFLLYWRNR